MGSRVLIEDELVGVGWAVGSPVGLVVAAFVKTAVVSTPGSAVISTGVVSSR